MASCNARPSNHGPCGATHNRAYGSGNNGTRTCADGRAREPALLRIGLCGGACKRKKRCADDKHLVHGVLPEVVRKANAGKAVRFPQPGDRAES